MRASAAKAMTDETVAKNDDIERLLESLYRKIKEAASKTGKYRLLWVMPDEPSLTDGQRIKLIRELEINGYKCVYDGDGREYLTITWDGQEDEIEEEPEPIKKKPWYDCMIP